MKERQWESNAGGRVKKHGGKERHRDDQVESQKRRERGAQLAQTTVSDGCVHVYTLYTYNMYKL